MVVLMPKLIADVMRTMVTRVKPKAIGRKPYDADSRET
jgi:hypothetical protein